MRILVVIDSPLFVRNYISTKAFSSLQDHDVSFCSRSSVDLSEVTKTLNNAKITELNHDSDARFRRYALRLNNQLLMYQKRLINPNFLFRLRRELIPVIYSLWVVPGALFSRTDNRYYSKLPFSLLNESLARHLTSLILVLRGAVLNLPGLLRYGFISILTRVGLSQKLTSLLWRKVPLEPRIISALRDLRPDLIMIPSQAIDPTSYEWVRASAQEGIGKTLLLIDNWDNLSSKSVFVRPPDFMGVMGKQSFHFGIELHEMDRERISIIGTPRFEVYKEYRPHKSSVSGKKKFRPAADPYILFAGCAVPFDEIGALRALSQAVAQSQDQLPPDTKIVYRPHPWGELQRYLGELEKKPVSNVIVDPQIVGAGKIEGVNFQPDLTYYPQLLSEALLVVCPLSTMLLETTIMRKRVIALTHEDHRSLLSPNRIFSTYRHFEGVERLVNVALVSDLAKLKPAIQKAHLDGDLQDIPDSLDYFVDMSGPSYSKRLSELVDRIELF